MAGLAGCDDGTGTTAQELLGLWGGVEYEYTRDADPGTTVDIVNDLGGTYSITLISGGTYSWQLLVSGTNTTGTGTFEVSGNRLTLTPTGGSPTTYTFTFDEIFLTLRNEEASYDFGSGEEPASLRILLDRF